MKVPGLPAEAINKTQIENHNHLFPGASFNVMRAGRWGGGHPMTSIPLRMEETRSGQICVVSLTGCIDSKNSNELLERLNKLLSMGEKNILLDFKEVLYLTSAAFRVLLMTTNQARLNAAKFALCCVVGQVRELFEMASLFEVFTIHGSREDAVARLEG